MCVSELVWLTSVGLLLHSYSLHFSFSYVCFGTTYLVNDILVRVHLSIYIKLTNLASQAIHVSKERWGKDDTSDQLFTESLIFLFFDWTA